jgi:AcrR family transcriptional regulator
LKEKPFEKITIHEITADCGVARMTFYYHFQDIYDLLDYIIEEKLRASVSRAFTYETWQDDYLAVFHTILEEKDFFL